MGENKPVYKRVLIKLSGEALAGSKSQGLDFDVMNDVCRVIKKCVGEGVEVGIMVGGGNFWRGAKDGVRMERSRADHMGMMATVMNCLALADVLEQMDVPVRVQTALEIRAVAEPYIRLKADKHLKNGRVVIFGCGTGNPFFSTDTAAVLRAAEIGADAILLAKNVDGEFVFVVGQGDDRTGEDVLMVELSVDEEFLTFHLMYAFRVIFAEGIGGFDVEVELLTWLQTGNVLFESIE